VNIVKYESVFETTLLLRDPFIAVVRDDHPFSQKRRIRWRNLEKESLIFFRRSSGSGTILERALKRKASVQNWKYEVQHPTTALGLVLAGAGIAVLPSLGALRGVYPRLRAIPLVEPLVRRDIGLIRLSNTALTLEASRLCDMLLEEISHTHKRPTLR